MQPYPLYMWYAPEHINVVPIRQAVPTPALQERPLRSGILKSSTGIPDPGKAQPAKTLRFRLEPTAIGQASSGVGSVELAETSNEAWSTALSSTITAEDEPPESNVATPPPSPSEDSEESEVPTEVAKRGSSSHSENRGSASSEISSAKSSSTSGRGSRKGLEVSDEKSEFQGSWKKRARHWIPEEIRQYLTGLAWLGDVGPGGGASGSSLPASRSSSGEWSSLAEEDVAQRAARKRYAAFTLLAGLLMLMVAAVTASIEGSASRSDQSVMLDQDGTSLPIPIEEESASVVAMGPRIHDGGSDEGARIAARSHDDGSYTTQQIDGPTRPGKLKDVTAVANDGGDGHVVGDVQEVTDYWRMDEHANPSISLRRKAQVPKAGSALRAQPVAASKHRRYVTGTKRAAISTRGVAGAPKGASELLGGVTAASASHRASPEPTSGDRKGTLIDASATKWTSMTTRKNTTASLQVAAKVSGMAAARGRLTSTDPQARGRKATGVEDSPNGSSTTSTMDSSHSRSAVQLVRFR
ncbi:uncharacterized protein [Dermacentor albipictus]|uniref:uncharacterized protein n=1 Tax=Dermacentor albipictus TaxID=60249 RepID=UPI0031FD9A36